MAYISKLLTFILFVDDTNILYLNSVIWELERIVNTDLLILLDWFKANRLSLNIQKTNFMLFGSKHIPFTDSRDFQIKIDSTNISRAATTMATSYEMMLPFISQIYRYTKSIKNKIAKKLPTYRLL